MAMDFTPQVGTWAIDEEVNGEPGRGFQIDVQNDVLVLYFYGYEPTGESTYWLAAGKFAKGSNELTMDLGAYEGGMAFGDPFKNATYLGPRGQVTVRFDGITYGEICLPSESCKAISAFNFGYSDSAEAVLGGWVCPTNRASGRGAGPGSRRGAADADCCLQNKPPLESGDRHPVVSRSELPRQRTTRAN